MSSVGRRDPCAHHRRRPSVTNCVACAAPLCSDCVVHTPVGFKCTSCTTRVVAAPRQARSTGRGRRIGSLVAAAVLAAGGFTAYWLSPRDRGMTVYARPSQGSVADPGPIDQAVRLAGAGGFQIGANLLTPGGAGRRAPGMLIVPDTGSVDRDGPVSPGGVPDPLYKELAQGLAQKGMSSLRYDPRGQGESTLPAGTPLRLSDLVDDAKAGLQLLSGRAVVDAAHLAVVGEGAGGLVALQLAAQDADVKALILVSTPGRPMPASLADEVRALAPTPADGDALAAQLQSEALAVVAGAPVPSPAQLPSALRPIFPAGEDAFLRSLFSLDPPGIARGVHVPVLLVRGGQDPSTTAADTQALVAALGPLAQPMVAEQSDHTLDIVSMTPVVGRASPTGLHGATMAGRAIVVRDTATLTAIAEWVVGRFGAPTVGGASDQH